MLSKVYRTFISSFLRQSTHPYSTVRREAQADFDNGLRALPWLHRSYIPALIKRLSRPAKSVGEVTGAIYLLQDSRTIRRIKGDWR